MTSGRSHPPTQVRNIGIMAHIDAGKTTCTERILFYAGKTHRLGEVHDGKATMDWMPQEQERGITISSAATTISWRDHQINVIDTPGHVDFTAEVERSLRILDGAIGLFCAVGGVEPQSEMVWRQADKYEVPRICFVNKMDRIGADFWSVLRAIERELGATALPLTIPIGQGPDFAGIVDVVEQVAIFYHGDRGEDIRRGPIPPALKEEAEHHRHSILETVGALDEEILELVCADEFVTPSTLRQAIRRTALSHATVPVLCGSAFKNKGIQHLLDAVVDYLPSPVDLPPICGTCLKGEPQERLPLDDGRLAALVFKVVADRHVGKLVYTRVYSGTMEAGSYVHNATLDKQQRVGRILRMHANRQEMVDRLYSGEIGAIVGLSDSSTGDTLCCKDNPIILEAIEFPAPVISIAVSAQKNADRDKLSRALSRLAEEDPTFVVSRDPETEDTIIAGMGELHLEIIIDRLRREYDVSVDSGAPEVAYRETLTSPVSHRERFVKQTGGRGQFAEVEIIVEPMPPGAGFDFVNETVGGSIPREYVPAVERGIIGAMQRGIWAGFPVVDLRVRLIDGRHHDVDSSEQAFRTCGSIAFKQAFLQGNPELLEPVMSIVVTSPDEFSGVVTTSICARRGRITGMDLRGTARIVRGMVPLASMFGYVSDLRNQTQGRASFTMHFEHYEAVPYAVAEEIIAARKSRLKG